MHELLKVGLVQLRVSTNHRQDNLDRAAGLLQRAADQDCRLVVLPEAFATGLDLPRCSELAEPIAGPTVHWLAEQALRHRLHLAAGLLEAEEGRVYSTTVLLDPQGELLARYRRIYIYDLESYFLTGGKRSVVIDTELGRVGLITGYDVQFPEVARLLFGQRVELMLCPALLLRPFADSIRQMVRARAAENCCYLLFASATGENTLAGLTYLGNSTVVQSPVGLRPYSNAFRGQPGTLVETGWEETLLTAELNLTELRRLQEANPLFKDYCRAGFFGSAEAPCAALEAL